LGQGQGGTGAAVREDPGAGEEGPGEDAAAVVCERPGSDDGGDSWPGGVHDGFAAHGGSNASRRIATPEANRTDVCPCGQVRDGERVRTVSQGQQPGGVVRVGRPESVSDEEVQSGGDWSCDLGELVLGGGVLQLVEPAGRDPRGPMVLRDGCPEADPGAGEC